MPQLKGNEPILGLNMPLPLRQVFSAMLELPLDAFV
jgi:hypothetical protein